MKIYGGRDYYDSMLAYGVDPAIVLQRDPAIVIAAKDIPQQIPTIHLSYSGLYPSSIDCDFVIVFFCDKIYRGLRVPHFPRLNDYLYFWDINKFKKWAEDGKLDYSVRTYWRDKDTKLANCLDVIDASPELKEFMIKHRIAIMLDIKEVPYSDSRPVKVNPSGLKNIEFFRVLGPYEAYQELSMWVGGVLGGQSPETVTITDDKVLIENHGYDKHSFRSSVRKSHK